MNNFSWPKAVGFGVLIWAVMAISLWVLSSVSSLSALWAHGIVAVVGGIAAVLTTLGSDPHSGVSAIKYSLVWTAIVLILDFAVTQWLDAHVFAIWQYWLGAALVFGAPWVHTEVREVFSHKPSQI